MPPTAAKPPSQPAAAPMRIVAMELAALQAMLKDMVAASEPPERLPNRPTGA